MKPERNSPCPCGSGKKYKKCCADKGKAPSSAEINQLIALFNASRHSELESQARLLVERYPDSGYIWKVLGVAIQMQGKEALPALQKAAALLPGDAEAYSNLGAALKDLGQLDAAVASYRRALEIHPDYAGAHNNLGNLLKDLGELDDAAECFRMALKISPDYAEAHNNLGIVLRDTGHLEDAVASYRLALKLKPTYAEAHSNLGNALKDVGNLEEAVAS